MNTCTCSHCGCVLSVDEEFVFQDEIYCEDCLDELTVLCDHCGRRIYCDNAECDSNLTLCDHCFSNHYTSCERCGRLIPNEDAYYDDSDEDTPYCYNCYLSFSHIHNYNYKPDPVFYGLDSRYFGVELEVDKGGEIHSKAKRVADLADGRLYCKHDGSLNDGFEVVSHPMTLDYHCNRMPWQEIVDLLKEMGYRSHQTSTAGLHIHVNRNSLGDTYDEEEETIARILFFVEKHWNEMVKFSRRTASQLTRWADRYGYKESPKDILKTAKGGYGRYTCVNLCNEYTLEFRIFRGTLKYNTLIATLQLVNQICNVDFSLDDEELKAMSWATFVAGCKEPELIQYLKERNLYINDPVECEAEV